MLNQSSLKTPHPGRSFWQADQAAGLRDLLQAPPPQVSLLLNAYDADTQSLWAAKWAVEKQESGQRVMLLDQTSGKAALALGLAARYELAHTQTGDLTLQQVSLPYRPSPSDATLAQTIGELDMTDSDDPLQAGSLTVLPCARGLKSIGDQPQQLLETVRAANAGHVMPDSLVINSESACLDGLLALKAPQQVATSSMIWLFVPARAQGLTTAYGLLKRVVAAGIKFPIQVLISQAHEAQQATHSFDNLAATCQRFLGIQINYAGFMCAPSPTSPAHKTRHRTPAIPKKLNRTVSHQQAATSPPNLSHSQCVARRTTHV